MDDRHRSFSLDAWGVLAYIVLVILWGGFVRATGSGAGCGSGAGFGLRCQRFAAIVEDGVVKKLAVEEPMKFDVSSAEAILAAL